MIGEVSEEPNTTAVARVGGVKTTENKIQYFIPRCLVPNIFSISPYGYEENYIQSLNSVIKKRRKAYSTVSLFALVDIYHYTRMYISSAQNHATFFISVVDLSRSEFGRILHFLTWWNPDPEQSFLTQ